MNTPNVLQEALNELFSNHVNWKWSFRGSEEVEADFTVGDIPYKFYAFADSAVVDDEGNDVWNMWSVEFRQAGTRDRNKRFGLSGTGNAPLVMATVVDIMRNMLEGRSYITKLIFSAKEESRQGLYKRMVQRLLPAWDVQQDGTEFTVTKPEVQI